MKLLRTVGILLLLFSAQTYASKNIYTGWFSNKAVSGYDPVAYFTQGKPVKGNSQYQYDYQGVEWYFSSAENRELFVKNPEKYSPQYGGYCAWAVAEKKKRAPGDPSFWNIVGGKLYLNYDASIQQKWLEDVPGFIKAADDIWPKMIRDSQ